MNAATPHYLLYSQTMTDEEPGRWKVVLQAADGSETFTATDCEPEDRGERLELLAVVRGLEALDQPSCVSLVTPSKYVRRGLANGLAEWRANGWSWEWYGQMVPVKNADLWQRVDRALKFHQVQFRYWRIDAPHQAAGGTHRGRASEGSSQAGKTADAVQSDTSGKNNAGRKGGWLSRLGGKARRAAGAIY